MSNAVSLRPPKYRRHKAKGLALVTINGRDIYLGKYGTAASKQKYRRAVAEHLQGGANGNGGARDVTVAEIMAAYLRFAKGYYRKGGVATREYSLIVECCGFVKRLYSHTRAADFGPLALKAVRQAMIDADHSRKYINKNIERIRRMFKWAAAEELIASGVPQSLSMVTGLRQGRSAARETAPVKPVDDVMVDATLPHLPAVIADMVRLQHCTGMRPGEICIVRPCDVDRSGDVWLYRPATHKTEHHGRPRVVYIGREGQAVLGKYLLRDPQTACFRPCDSEGKRRAAVHAARKTPQNCGNRPGTNRRAKPKHQPGASYDVCAYRRAISRACDKAFPHPTLELVPTAELTESQRLELHMWRTEHRWAPNRLRHSYATRVRRECGLDAAQVVLGHSSADVTQIYAELDVAKGVEVARKLG